MIVTRSMNTSTVENFDHNNQAVTLCGQFDISNDKFYSNRKMLQQAKSHTEKCSSMGIKVVHSFPAQKLQSMKPKLSEYEPPSPYFYSNSTFMISHHVLD
jgi:transcription initiation factor TFIID subunit 1